MKEEAKESLEGIFKLLNLGIGAAISMILRNGQSCEESKKDLEIFLDQLFEKARESAKKIIDQKFGQG